MLPGLRPKYSRRRLAARSREAETRSQLLIQLALRPSAGTPNPSDSACYNNLGPGPDPSNRRQGQLIVELRHPGVGAAALYSWHQASLPRCGQTWSAAAHHTAHGPSPVDDEPHAVQLFCAGLWQTLGVLAGTCNNNKFNEHCIQPPQREVTDRQKPCHHRPIY